MGDGTKIEWCDATWNAVRGCSRVSPGCVNCYAERVAARFSGKGQPYEGLAKMTDQGPRWTRELRLVSDHLADPIRWTKPRRIFVNSMSDLFHESLSDHDIDQVFGVMHACEFNRHGAPGHIFQVLTKRADRMHAYLSQDRRRQWAVAAAHWGGGRDPDGIYDQVALRTAPHPRIWLGVSVEDQQRANERIPWLLETPAAVRFLSCEPLLGPVDLTKLPVLKGDGRNKPTVTLDALTGHVPASDDILDTHIDWVIVGGESGPGARPMHPAWARQLRDQCVVAGVSFFFKQWGDWGLGDARDPKMVGVANDESLPIDDHRLEVVPMVRVGKQAAGRELDGQTWNQFPEVNRG